MLSLTLPSPPVPVESSQFPRERSHGVVELRSMGRQHARRQSISRRTLHVRGSSRMAPSVRGMEHCVNARFPRGGLVPHGRRCVERRRWRGPLPASVPTRWGSPPLPPPSPRSVPSAMAAIAPYLDVLATRPWNDCEHRSDSELSCRFRPVSCAANCEMTSDMTVNCQSSTVAPRFRDFGANFRERSSDGSAKRGQSCRNRCGDDPHEERVLERGHRLVGPEESGGTAARCASSSSFPSSSLQCSLLQW